MSVNSASSTYSPQRLAERFQYPSVSGESAGDFSQPPVTTPLESARAVADTRGMPVGELRTYEKGLEDGETRARAATEKALAEVRSQVATALREFSVQRETYFERVEAEVVKLTLSITRKILHRESQMDPMLLTGVVRVALEGLNEHTHVRLRAHPDEVRFWREYYSHASDIRPVPEVVGDPTLSVGNCTLETDLGSTDISFGTQLKEIEQGFLDLLDQRTRGA